MPSVVCFISYGIRLGCWRIVGAYDGFSALPPATKQQYQANAQQVYDLLQSHQAAYVRLTSAGAFALALHEARIVVQYTTLGVLIPTGSTLFASETAYDRRDAFMAENVEWLYDQQRGAPGGAGKIVIWAHNVRIASLHQPQNMGAILRARYQDGSLRIGTSFFQGSFTILRGGPASVLTAPTPAADSYNSALGSIGAPLYALDIHPPPPGAVTDWIAGPHALINFGVGGQDLEMDGSLRYWFDVVVHIQRLTPSHLLG